MGSLIENNPTCSADINCIHNIHRKGNFNSKIDKKNHINRKVYMIKISCVVNLLMKQMGNTNSAAHQQMNSLKKYTRLLSRKPAYAWYNGTRKALQ